MAKIWKIKEKGNEGTINKLAAELNINYVLANLLVQRVFIPLTRQKPFSGPALMIYTILSK